MTHKQEWEYDTDDRLTDPASEWRLNSRAVLGWELVTAFPYIYGRNIPMTKLIWRRRINGEERGT